MSNNLDEALRILKQNKILKSDVAKTLGINPNYFSKIISGNQRLTVKNLKHFNRQYKKYVRLELSGDQVQEDVEETIKITPEMALLRSLTQDYAAFKSSVTNLPQNTILEDIFKNAEDLLGQPLPVI